MYLASSGIGEIVLIDHDEVEISNLQRQIIFQTEDIGKKKATVAREVLRRLNPKVNRYLCWGSPKMPGFITAGTCVYIDASDNFDTRFF